MRKFIRDTKGAVTVFVTLLLIPAILVSGTGVDLARIYAARSAAHDANQLAANSVLASYDALLQDLYGLYAVVDKDDNLTAMVDAYVKASLFGEEVTDAQRGEFRLFGGRESVSPVVNSFDPLSSVKILRRQIEEYAKWRVPVSIVSEIINRLSGKEFEQASADIKASQDKIAVDEQLLVVSEKYRAVYDTINKIVEKYNASEGYVYNEITGYFSRIKAQISELYTVRTQYEAEADEEKRTDIEAHYNAVRENISALVNGGTVGGSSWVPGDWTVTGYVEGDWSNSSGTPTDGIKSAIKFDIDLLKSTESSFDNLIELCIQANAAKDELRTRLDQLDTTLNAGSCTPVLVTNMREEIAAYRELLKWDFAALAKEMKDADISYINGRIVPELEAIQGYGNVSNNNEVYDIIKFDTLGNLRQAREFEIGFNNVYDNGVRVHLGEEDKLKILNDEVNTVLFTVPGRFPGFDGDCYAALENLGDLGELKSEDDLNNTEKKQKNNLLGLYKTLKEVWDGIADYDPAPGAVSYPNESEYRGHAYGSEPAGPTLNLGLGVFSENMGTQLKTLMNLITGNTTIQDIVGGILTEAGNRVLLVGYDINMFSSWTTQYYEESDQLLSLSGTPINAAHNYFYLSEFEYLYNGSSDAQSNLGAVSGTLLVIRFVANYASSYIISELNTEIQSAEGVVSAIPYAGAVLRFLVRPLYAFAESTMDVSRLRTGHAAPLLKTELDQWTVSLSGAIGNVAEELANGALNDIAEATLGEIQTETDSGSGLSLFSEKEKGLLYTDYLTLFLLAGDPDAIARRTGDLIALNVTTVKHQIAQNDPANRADERAAAIKGIKLFDLSEVYTTFSVATETEVRFMFLSMPFAQKGINGIVPPTTFPVVVTDYRGY